MMRIAGLLIAAMMCIALPQQALAKWREAQSEHFVIYANDSETDLRRFSEMLERYHSAMEYVSGREAAAPSPSNRLTIFVVGGERDVQRLARGGSNFLAGFYVPRAGNSMAFVQDMGRISGKPNTAMTILLHEYAHHFLQSTSRYAMPRWMSEGAAEFYASAEFGRDGSVSVGRPALHRAGELFYADDVSVEELFDPALYAAQRGNSYDAFYGRSWLLYHYLFYPGPRRGQLTEYWVNVANGLPPLEAARSAFGDLDALEKELDAYLRQGRMPMLNLTPDLLSFAPVTVRELRKGEAEAMDIRMASQRGVDQETAIELVGEARELAAKYPDDPAVLSVLAEAEFDAGELQAAIAAADRAIALDPTLVNPYLQKGYALFVLAEQAEADEAEAAWAAAQAPFTALNAMENDHPLPLQYFYRIQLQQTGATTELARHALERASQLALFDLNLAFNAGAMQASEGKIALARQTLMPVAFAPHGGTMADQAKKLLDALNDAEEGQPVRAEDVLVQSDD